jgi:glycosyltransferase involved in cell wall biosynthesis
VIFTSEQERLEARQSFWLYRAREQVSPLGVERPVTASAVTTDLLTKHFPQLRGTRPLLFLGRLHPKKGCDLAIDAFAAVARDRKDISLVLGGPDQVGWKTELERRARDLGVESRVLFTGMLQGELKQSALLNADALILPSHQENFGMAVVEGLAVGVPALISDRINISGEIAADRAGYVASDDLAGTTSLLRRWLDTPDTDREVMRRNARNCFANRYEIERAVDSLLKILGEPQRG